MRRFLNFLRSKPEIVSVPATELRENEVEQCYSSMLANSLKFRTFDLMPAQFDQFAGPDKSKKILVRILRLTDRELLVALSAVMQMLNSRFTRNSKPYQQVKRVGDILKDKGSAGLKNGDFDIIRRMLDTNPLAYRHIALHRVQNALSVVQVTNG